MQSSSSNHQGGHGGATTGTNPNGNHTIFNEVEFDDDNLEELEELEAEFSDDENDQMLGGGGDLSLDDYNKSLAGGVGGGGKGSDDGGLGGGGYKTDDLADYEKLLVETKAADVVAQQLHPPAISNEKAPTMDDFFRNFLVKNGLNKTLDCFQGEWMEYLQRKGGDGTVPEEDSYVPDLYVKTQQLSHEIQVTKSELQKAQHVAAESKRQWDRFRKERDFHRMHHRRVVQERRKLLSDFERLKTHYNQYEPTLAELRHRYEVLMKEKMLMRLERDRLSGKVETMSEQLDTYQRQAADINPDGMENPMGGDDGLGSGGAGGGSNKKKNKGQSRGGPGQGGILGSGGMHGPGGVGNNNFNTLDTPWPYDNISGGPPQHGSRHEPIKVSEMKLVKSLAKCHSGPIARLAFHPKIPVIGTVSDDHTWKLWSVPGGDLVMSGEGHRDWLSDISFHNKGNLIATTSGDSTVKIWDMTKEACRHTFTDHTQATWSCCFHPTHDFLVTSSMDHTARVFDLNSNRCRQTLRGHVDSVNSVCFQPFGSNIATASGDKTVSLWDLRSGLCVQTFYGHANSVNHCRFNNSTGDVLVSSDCDGIVKLWDIRVISEFLQVDAGPHPTNSADFDASGRVLGIASGDGSVKLFDLEQKSFVKSLEGHEDSVQDIKFDPNNKFLVSCGSDATVRIWQ